MASHRTKKKASKTSKPAPRAYPKIRVTVVDTCGQECIHKAGEVLEFTNPYTHPIKMCEVLASILEPYILAHSLGEVDWKPEAPNPDLSEKDKEKGLVYCPSKGGIVLKIERID